MPALLPPRRCPWTWPTSLARARAYADLKSREAAMFGEFQFETVPITK